MSKDASRNRIALRFRVLLLSIASCLGLLWSSAQAQNRGMMPQLESSVSDTGITRLESPSEGAPKSLGDDVRLEVQTNPVIDVWYGLTQPFGQPGNAQNWVNILGTVTDPDGIQSLVYSLNGGADQPLNWGPDYRRLDESGDFNVDLDYTLLNAGTNTLLITATDDLGFQTIREITLNYSAGNTWPLPYSIPDWSAVSNVQDVVQVVDGKWLVTGDELRLEFVDNDLDGVSDYVGYDRVIDFGDLSWTNYEITVPITLHDSEPPGPNSGSSGGFGFIARWTGHTDYPVPNQQPKSGWLPTGAAAFYNLASGLGMDNFKDISVIINEGDTYNWKFRVGGVPGQGGLYKVKVWPDGQPEPGAWNIEKQRGPIDEANGSLILYAHHTDVSLGSVQIDPVLLSVSLERAIVTSSTPS